MAGRRALVSRTSMGALGGLVVGVLATLLTLQLTSGPAPADGPSGELVILSGKDESQGGQRQKLIDRWNAAHPELRARVELLSGNTDAQRSDMLATAQSGRKAGQASADGPGALQVDIFNLDVTAVPQFAGAGYIRPLDHPKTDGFLEGPLKTGRYEGEQWALPFNTDAGLLYYRTDLIRPDALPAALPPTAGDAASLLGLPGPFTAGYAGQSKDYEGLTVNAVEAIWGEGGEVVDDKGAVVIDSDAAVRGLLRLAASQQGPAGGKPVAFPEADEDISTAAFVSGKVPLMRNWPVAYDKIAAAVKAGEAGKGVAGHFGVAPLPTPSVLGGQDLAVAAGSRNPRAAQQLIEFLTSPESQITLFADGGFAAVREETYTADAVTARRPYADELLTAVKGAKPRPVTVHYANFSAELRRIVVEVRKSDRLPADAGARLAQAMRGLR